MKVGDRVVVTFPEKPDACLAGETRSGTITRIGDRPRPYDGYPYEVQLDGFDFAYRCRPEWLKPASKRQPARSRGAR